MENPMTDVSPRSDEGTPEELRKPRFSNLRVSQVNLLANEQQKTFCRRQRKAIIGASLLAALGVIVVIAIVVFTRAERGLAVPQKFSSSFTSTSRYDASISWTGSVHKDTDSSGNWVVQGQATMTRQGVRTVVTMLNQRVYIQEFNASTNAAIATGCQTAVAEALPLGDLTWVFSNAAPLSADESPVIDAPGCAGVKKYSLQWGLPTRNHKNDYTYCSLGGGKHELAGSEFVATMFDFTTQPSPLSLAVPTNFTSGQPMSCPALPFDRTQFSQSSARRLGARRLVRVSYDRSYNLPSNSMPVPMPNLRSPPISKCILVGGLASGSLSGYWGDIASRLHSCMSIVYIDDADWRTGASSFCSTASTSGSLQGLILSHGSGSMLVAAAIAKGTCQVHPGLKWVSSQPIIAPCPMASVVDSNAGFCLEHPIAVEALGVCENPGYASEASFLGLTDGLYNDILTAHRSYAQAVMCGVSPQGVLKNLDVQYAANSAAPGIQTDGLLPAQGCASGIPLGEEFSTSAQSYFYAGQVNHEDGSCRNGDAFFDPALVASPCTWIETAVNN